MAEHEMALALVAQPFDRRMNMMNQAFERYALIVEEDQTEREELELEMKAALNIPVLSVNNSDHGLKLLSQVRMFPHRLTGIFTCPVCLKQFHNKEQLVTHRTALVGSPCFKLPNQCLECTATGFADAAAVSHHYVVHKNVRHRAYVASLEQRVDHLENALASCLGGPSLVVSGSTTKKLRNTVFQDRLVAVPPQSEEDISTGYQHAAATVPMPMDDNKRNIIRSLVHPPLLPQIPRNE